MRDLGTGQTSDDYPMMARRWAHHEATVGPHRCSYLGILMPGNEVLSIGRFAPGGDTYTLIG